MRLALVEAADALLEREQRLVDLGALLPRKASVWAELPRKASVWAELVQISEGGG